MTEKRFYISGIGISDRERKRLYDLKTVDGFISVRDLLNELSDENEQLKQTIDELRTIDKEKNIETEHINNIYKEFGFKGIIDYAKDKLQNYGAVREVEKGLWVMITGGWSDNEFWLDCLNNPISIFSMNHYCAYERGGAFYYTEKPHDNIEIKLKR